MQHRAYRLRTPVMLLGLELPDWLVIALTWLVTKQLAGSLLGARLSLLAALAGTFLVFRAWRRARDRAPDKLAAHLLAFLTEATTYRVTPDTRNAPLVVRTDAIAPRDDRALAPR